MVQIRSIAKYVCYRLATKLYTHTSHKENDCVTTRQIPLFSRRHRRNRNRRKGRTYKSLLSKHCSQKSALLGGRTRRAEVDMVLGNPLVAPMPAFKAGELIPPPHLFKPPADPTNSIKPPLESDMALHIARAAPHPDRSA